MQQVGRGRAGSDKTIDCIVVAGVYSGSQSKLFRVHSIVSDEFPRVYAGIERNRKKRVVIREKVCRHVPVGAGAINSGSDSD
jgi:hypothetical protein